MSVLDRATKFARAAGGHDARDAGRAAAEVAGVRSCPNGDAPWHAAS